MKSSVAGRVESIEKLAEACDTKALLALEAFLPDPATEVRAAVGRALGNFPDERAARALMSLARDPDSSVRAVAVSNLASIRCTAAVPIMTPLLSDSDSAVRAATLRALQSLGWEPESDLDRALQSVAMGEFAVAAVLGAAAVEPLLKMLADPAPLTRCAIIEVLPQIKDSRVTSALTAMIDDPDSSVRAAAVGALGRSGDESQLPVIVAQLDSADRNLRVCAVEALANLRVGELPALLAPKLKDADWNVRAAAAAALGANRDGVSLDPLIAALGDEDTDVRQVIAEAIGSIGDPKGIEPLILAMLDAESRVRQSAANALMRIDLRWHQSEGARRTRRPLKRALRSSDYWLRQAATELLSRIFHVRPVSALTPLSDPNEAKRQRVLAVLSNALWNDDALLRSSAAWGLGQLGDQQAIGPLEAKKEDGDDAVREAVAEALAHLTTRE